MYVDMLLLVHNIRNLQNAQFYSHQIKLVYSHQNVIYVSEKQILKNDPLLAYDQYSKFVTHEK